MRQAPFLDFPLDEYRRRYEQLQQEMARDRLDSLLLTSRDNVEYLAGFTTVSWRLSTKRFWLFVPARREPVLFVDGVHLANAEATSWVEDVRVWGEGGKSNAELVADLFRTHAVASRRAGLELGEGSSLRMSASEYMALRGALPSAVFVDAGPALGRARMVKSPAEVERIARACEITEAGHRAGFQALRAGATEREIIAEMVIEWTRHGADDPANSTNPGYLSLQAGRVKQMGPSPVDRRIDTGDLVQVDGGAVYRGYSSDIYRNAYVGDRLPENMRAYSERTRDVLAAVTGSIRPGVTSAELCEAATRAADQTGMARFRRTLTNATGPRAMYLGHGMGFSLIELPHITSEDRTPWVEGMCGTVLVSFGDDQTGFIEWEDNFVVTEGGARILSPSPKEIWLTG